MTLIRDDFENSAWQWRIPFAIQTIPSSILAIGILFCPHSPRWLISQDREEEAEKVLTKLRSTTHNAINEEFHRIRNEVAYLREYEVETYRQLFRFPLLRPLLLGIGIQMLQQLSGINSVVYYAPKIFTEYSYIDDKSAWSEERSFYSTGIYGIVNVIFTIPTLILIDRLGRRVLLITGATIMSISMLVVAIILAIDEANSPYRISSFTMYIITMSFVGLFVAAFAFSWGPVSWLYCTEIFPLTMRAKATSLTTAANWATNCAISFLVPTLLSYLHYGLFIMFAILCALMLIIVYLLYPETKGRQTFRTI